MSLSSQSEKSQDFKKISRKYLKSRIAFVAWNWPVFIASPCGLFSVYFCPFYPFPILWVFIKFHCCPWELIKMWWILDEHTHWLDEGIVPRQIWLCKREFEAVRRFLCESFWRYLCLMISEPTTKIEKTLANWMDGKIFKRADEDFHSMLDNFPWNLECFEMWKKVRKKSVRKLHSSSGIQKKIRTDFNSQNNWVETRLIMY